MLLVGKILFLVVLKSVTKLLRWEGTSVAVADAVAVADSLPRVTTMHAW